MGLFFKNPAGTAVLLAGVFTIPRLLEREVGGQTLIYRKEAGDSDISGDYNVYDTEKEVDADGRDAVLKGNRGKYKLAVFTSCSVSYSLYCENGLSENKLVAVITEIVLYVA